MIAWNVCFWPEVWLQVTGCERSLLLLLSGSRRRGMERLVLRLFRSSQRNALANSAGWLITNGYSQSSNAPMATSGTYWWQFSGWCVTSANKENCVRDNQGNRQKNRSRENNSLISVCHRNPASYWYWYSYGRWSAGCCRYPVAPKLCLEIQVLHYAHVKTWPEPYRTFGKALPVWLTSSRNWLLSVSHCMYWKSWGRRFVTFVIFTECGNL